MRQGHCAAPQSSSFQPRRLELLPSHFRLESLIPLSIVFVQNLFPSRATPRILSLLIPLHFITMPVSDIGSCMCDAPGASFMNHRVPIHIMRVSPDRQSRTRHCIHSCAAVCIWALVVLPSFGHSSCLSLPVSLRCTMLHSYFILYQYTSHERLCIKG